MTTNNIIEINGTNYRIVGNATVEGYNYPILNSGGNNYHVYLGGAAGISDEIEFDSDEQAIAELTAEIAAELADERGE